MKSARLRMLLGLAGLALAAAPALAQPYPPPPPPPPGQYPSGPPPQYYDRQPRDQFVEFRLWAGDFIPSFHSQFWNDNFNTFTGNRNDFQDVIGGGDFVFHFDRYNALMVSGSFYQGSDTEAFRDFLDQNNNQIFHRTTLDIDSATVAYTLYPAGPRGPVIPYLGAGVGIFSWRLHQVGDFIDANNNIFGASASESGTSFGYVFLAGLEIPVTRHVALLVDGRYTMAHASLGGDFNGFGRLDLSGGQVAGGIAFHL